MANDSENNIATNDSAAKTSKRERKSAKAKAKRPAAKSKKPATAKAKSAKGRRAGSKKGEVIDLMRRPGGATLAEIVEATGWQKHTVRGFVSILGSKGGVKIASSKNSEGERAYRIAK